MKLINLEDKDLDSPVYRIMPINRLFDMLENQRLILPLIKTWEDVYENFFLKSKFKDNNGEIFSIEDQLEEYYGQCWSFTQDSDALWRIYSQDKQSIRIKSTFRKIYNLMNSRRTILCENGIGLIQDTFIGKVIYLPTFDMQEKMQGNGTLNINNSPMDLIVESLFLKRKEFFHENEVRIIYLADEENDPNSIKLNGYKFISFGFNTICNYIMTQKSSEKI